MPIRVALIGTGNIAVANHLPGIALCRDATVTALCDANPAALHAAAQASGIGATWTDPDALIREADIDAVIIATPNKAHRHLAVNAVQRGLHVLCEKPLAMTVDEARQMVEAAERAGVRHMIRPGTVLSQPPSSTTPSMGFARSSSSVSIANKFR